MILALVLACSGDAPAVESRARQPAGAVVLREGDIVFQQSRSSQSEAIRLATHSRYTHVGVVTMRSGEPWVFEAVQPVKVTPYAAWVDRGEGDHVVVKRLSDDLSAEQLAAMKAVGEPWLGRDYDLSFEWSDERMYCSELVYKLYDRGAGVKIGRTRVLGDFDLSSPVVQAKMKERYGDSVPLDEVVVSPQDLFEADELVMVMVAGSRSVGVP